MLLSSQFENLCIYSNSPKFGYQLVGRNIQVKLDESSIFSRRSIYPKLIISSEFIKKDLYYTVRMISSMDIDSLRSMLTDTFLQSYNLPRIDEIEFPTYKLEKLDNILSRILSVFVNKSTYETRTNLLRLQLEL